MFCGTRKIVFEDPCVAFYSYVERKPKVKKVKKYVCKEVKLDDPLERKVHASKRMLRNPNNGSFAVVLDEVNVYLEKLVEKAQKLGLTVSGDGTNRVKGGDIRNAELGDIVTFGTSTRFDVNWIRRAQYACEKSIIPIHRVSDWNRVMKAVKAFAAEKEDLLDNTTYYGAEPIFKDLKAATRSCGCRRTVKARCGSTVLELEDFRGIRGRLHDDFIKIGYDFYPVETECKEVEERYILYV